MSANNAMRNIAFACVTLLTAMPYAVCMWK